MQITREDIAVMLQRYGEKIAGYSFDPADGGDGFADAESISSYAADAVAAMKNEGFISGKPDNAFDPQTNATRAEASKLSPCLFRQY